MILDYNEVNKILDSFNNTSIKENEPLNYTENAKLPIRYFTLGNGNKHIVVTAAWHSNEIITTSFVIELMQYLVNNNYQFNNLKIHFIPILNPEGYLINTSAIKRKLPNKNITEYCYEYYKKFKYDALNPNNQVKLHQLMFEDIDYTCISSNYNILRDKVQYILSNHPKGSIIDWASNGNGIDLNSNTVNKLVSQNEYNKQATYNNIRLDIPSPIGYPGNNKDINFTQEIEILSLKNLLESLKDNIYGYFNYHSIGGIIYNRPESNDNFSTLYNYLLSKYYQTYTNYKVIRNKSNIITSVNDTLRIKYLGNLLIELSPMMGNPIGVYGDINNYNNTINSNIKSFIYTLSSIDEILSTTNNLLNNDIEKSLDIIDSKKLILKNI